MDPHPTITSTTPRDRPLEQPHKSSLPFPSQVRINYSSRVGSPLSTSYTPHSSRLSSLPDEKDTLLEDGEESEDSLLICPHETASLCSDISMSVTIAYIILNILRVLTVVSLILACVASTMLITLQFSHFGANFFIIVGLLSRIASCIALITTEIAIEATTNFYKKRIPVFTHGYSLAWTGVPMVVLSCGLLGDCSASVFTGSVVRAVSRKVTLSAGCCIGVMGMIYTLMPLVYWNSASGECRRIRRVGTPDAPGEKASSPFTTTTSSASSTYSAPRITSMYNPFRRSKPLPLRVVSKISSPMTSTSESDPFTPTQSAYSPAAPISRWSEMEYPAPKSPQPSDIYRVYGQL